MTVGTVIELGLAYAQLEPEGWVLFGCPDGTSLRWEKQGLPPQGPSKIVFKENSLPEMAGLFAMLCALLDTGRQETLSIEHLLFDEAVPSLVEAWLRGVQPGFPVCLETP